MVCVSVRTMDLVRVRATDREHQRAGRVGRTGVVSDVQGRWAQVGSAKRRSRLFAVLAPAAWDSTIEWVGETHCWSCRSPRTHLPRRAVLHDVPRPYLELVYVVLYVLRLPSDCLVDSLTPIERGGSHFCFCYILARDYGVTKVEGF